MSLSLRQEIEAGYDKLVEIARSITGNDEAARDLVGSGVLRALEHEGTYIPGSFFGWLFYIMRNLWRSSGKRDSRIRPLHDCIPASVPRDSSEMVDALLRVDSLPVSDRGLLALWCAGYTYVEIAEKRGIPTGTVKSRMHRIRRQIR